MSSKRLEFLLVFTVGAIGLFSAFYPTFLSGFERIQQDAGDSRFVHYVLEHSYLWLTGDPNHAQLWTPAFFHPAKLTLAYSDSLLGIAPLYWLPRLVGLDPQLALQFWMILLAGLNFLIAYWCFKKAFSLRPLAAAAGAYLFAFGSSRLVQIGHLQLLGQFYVLIALFAFVRFFQLATIPTAKRYTLAVLAALAVALQFYAGYYHFWFFFFFCFLALIWSLVLPSFRKELLASLKAAPASFILFLLLSVLLILPVFLPYWKVHQLVGGREIDDVLWCLPYRQAFINMGPTSVLYGWLHQFSHFSRIPSGGGEHLTGIGMLTLLVVFVSFWKERNNRFMRLLGFVCVTVVVLSLTSLFGFHLWRLVYYVVPGSDGIRAVARVGLALLLPASIAFALAIERLHHRHFVFALLLLIACMGEQLQHLASYHPNAVEKKVTQLQAKIDKHCEGFLYVPKTEHGDPAQFDYTHIDAMWAGLKTATPTINGYSGIAPPGWPFRDLAYETDAEKKAIQKALDVWLEKHDLDSNKYCWID